MPSKIDIEEQAAEAKWKLQRYVFAEPAVKGFKPPFEPEIMFAGAQWQAGKACATREEAQKLAQEHANVVNTLMQSHANKLAGNMKKAKP